ncbi:fibronectin type III domain-containing protein, partial [Riemerella anatipestifer]|nr:fibronectin type III domain-containing protein [Riemerella anatipestifer]MDY3358728.1 fibronectin type III domain-containing protein [Riemerella anatipestifer]
GKRYAWQVQAKSGNPVLGANPTEDNGIYKNNGLTEIFYFDYVEDCTLPTLLMAKNAGRGRVELSWNLSGKPSGLYQVQYRRRGSNTQWQTAQSYQPRYIITGLEDQTEYEYRVGNACGQLATAGNNDNPITDSHSAGNAYAYSGIQYFTTDSKDKTNQNYQCGVMPAVDITNKTPLQSLLGANEVFMAGDFPVTVLEAQGSNGIYSGTGYIVVPYLADTKVKVSFNNIKLNTDRKLIEGIIETTYDPNETAVAYASAGVGELFGDQGVKDITIDYEISDIKYVATPPPGKLVIEGNAGAGNNNDTGSGTSSQQELPVGKDYTIIDKKGNVWAVDEEGNVTKGGEVAKGGASTPENTSGVDSKGSATAITAKGIRVIFKNSPRSQYAFDEPTKALTSDYKELNGKLIPFKAVENKKEEPFIASVELTDSSISADSLIFKTSKGVKIASKKIGNDYELTLKGLYSYATEEVQAVIKQGDKYNIAGVFNLVHISPKEIKLNLIPTTGVRITEPQQQEIKNIYKKIGIDVSIKVTPPFDISPYLVDGKLPTEDVFGDLSKYSPAQNAIISAYKSKNEVGLEYYLFVTDKPSSNGQNGYMRLNGQFGFVYDQKARTIAHELAHGALRLEHPFSAFKNVVQGEVKNLMDYETENTNFIYPDWKQINDPKFKLYTFQGQNEGELAGKTWFTPDWKPLKLKTTSTIASEKGAPKGTVPGVVFDGTTYIYKNGVYKNEKGEPLPKSEIVEVNPSDTDIVYLFVIGDDICNVPTYSTDYKYASTSRENINYTDSSKVTPREVWSCPKNNVESSYQIIVKDTDKTLQTFFENLKETYDKATKFYQNCASQDWKPAEEPGIVPKCFWENTTTTDYYDVTDIAFMSGIIDGGYAEVDGIVEMIELLLSGKIAEKINSFAYAYTLAYLECRDKDIQLNKAEYKALLDKLSQVNKEKGIWSWVKKNYYEPKVESLEDKIKECEDANQLREDISEALKEIKESIDSWEEIKTLTKNIHNKISSYYNLVTSKTNEGRYEAGRLVVPVGSTVVPIVGQIGKATKISKTKTILKGVTELSENKTDDLVEKLIVKGEDAGIIASKVYRGVKYKDFIKTFTATEEQYRKAYQLWGEEKWEGLYQYFKTNNLNDGWPPFEGFVKITKTETGNELAGKVFDRFQGSGDISGKFASPVYGTQGIDDLYFTYDSRALKYNIKDNTNYIKFKFKDNLPSDLKFDYGDVQPWFGRQGLGDQVRSTIDFNDIRIRKYIEIIEQLEYKDGKWIKIK